MNDIKLLSLILEGFELSEAGRSAGATVIELSPARDDQEIHDRIKLLQSHGIAAHAGGRSASTDIIINDYDLEKAKQLLAGSLQEDPQNPAVTHTTSVHSFDDMDHLMGTLMNELTSLRKHLGSMSDGEGYAELQNILQDYSE